MSDYTVEQKYFNSFKDYVKWRISRNHSKRMDFIFAPFVIFSIIFTPVTLVYVILFKLTIYDAAVVGLIADFLIYFCNLLSHYSHYKSTKKEEIDKFVDNL